MCVLDLCATFAGQTSVQGAKQLKRAVMYLHAFQLPSGQLQHHMQQLATARNRPQTSGSQNLSILPRLTSIQPAAHKRVAIQNMASHARNQQHDLDSIKYALLNVHVVEFIAVPKEQVRDRDMPGHTP
jgi:hypothetical protein